MKKVSIILGFTFLLFFLSSCLHTLYPIFTEKDIVFKPELLGKWNNNKDVVQITSLAKESGIELPGKISAIKDKGYLISGDGEKYIVFLARIGKHLYFDYYPLRSEVQQNADEFYMQHMIKRHLSYRVDIINKDRFELSLLAGDFLENLIKQKKIRIRHEIDRDGSIIITAPTEELQQYILKYGDDPGAYESEKSIFTKANINL